MLAKSKMCYKKNYKILLPVIALGGFSLFYFSAASMVKILEYVTILSFLTAPVIGFLNLKAITSKEIPLEYYPKPGLIYLAYLGLLANVFFAMYYVIYAL